MAVDLRKIGCFLIWLVVTTILQTANGHAQENLEFGDAQTATSAEPAEVDLEIVPALLDAMLDETLSVRKAAASALEKIDPNSLPATGARLSVPKLIEALKDEDADARESSAYALADIGPDAGAAVPNLIEALVDEDADVREASAYALAEIGPAARAAVPGLVEALEDGDADVRGASIYALAEIGPAARAAVPKLAEALEDGDAGIRKESAYALAEIGPIARAAVSKLIEALEDGDADVREASAYALAKIGPIARAAVPKLIEALKDGDADVREASARALAEIGPIARAAVPKLIEALKDGDAGVRAASAYALEVVAVDVSRFQSLKNKFGQLKVTIIDLYYVVLSHYKDQPIVIQAMLLTVGIWLVPISIVILLWGVFPHVLANLAMPKTGQIALPKFRGFVNWFSLVTYIGNTKRPLVSWLRNFERYSNFEKSNTFNFRTPVKDRETYCDLGNEKVVASFTNAVSEGKEAYLWIAGQGGGGKSTLAFEIARRSKQKVVPLLVDEDWDGSLIEYVGTMLNYRNRTPTPRMVEKLGNLGNLLLILDGLSERGGESAQFQVGNISRKKLFRHLITTSRNDKPEGGSFEAFREVSVGAINSQYLKVLIGAYADNLEPQAVLKQLGPLLGDGSSINPLFAKMAIRQVAKGDELPSTYTELIVKYVQRLSPPNEAAPTEHDLLRAASIAAFECVKDDLKSQEIDPEFLVGKLDTENEMSPFIERGNGGGTIEPQRMLEWLLSCGLLQQNAINRNIRFAHDPIAEYLSARFMVKHAKLERPRRGVIAVLQRIKKSTEVRFGLPEAIKDAEKSQ
jgi:HEAT repeat protein